MVITTYNCHQMTFVRKKIENAATSGATELDLSGCSLTEILLKVFELASLQLLDLGTNRLITLPPEIGNLILLRELNLYDNQLTTLPSEIGKLTLLQELHLSSNQLTTLPPEIGNLTSLPPPESIFSAGGKSVPATVRLWPGFLGLAIAANVLELMLRKWKGLWEYFRGGSFLKR
jgi:Leucine-rich repeat (LRR) protein